MSEEDFDCRLSAAWRRFEDRLAGILEALPRDGGIELVVLTSAPGGGRPMLVLRRRVTTVTVSVAAERGRRRPAAPPGPAEPARGGRFRVGQEALVAGWAVSQLRTAGVVHPSFVRFRTVGCPADEPLPTGAVAERHARGELLELVEDALATVADAPITSDEDGDLLIRGDAGIVYVRVHKDVPVVDVFAQLRKIDDPVAAAVEANERNLASPLVMFVVTGGYLVVRKAVWSQPFRAPFLLDVLQVIMQLLADEPADA